MTEHIDCSRPDFDIGSDPQHIVELAQSFALTHTPQQSTAHRDRTDTVHALAERSDEAIVYYHAAAADAGDFALTLRDVGAGPRADMVEYRVASIGPGDPRESRLGRSDACNQMSLAPSTDSPWILPW